MLYWVMKEIEQHPALALQVAATGMHFSARHGETWRVIEQDGTTENILAKTALARQARATAQLVSQYAINPASAVQYTDEQRAFARSVASCMSSDGTK